MTFAVSHADMGADEKRAEVALDELASALQRNLRTPQAASSPAPGSLHRRSVMTGVGPDGQSVQAQVAFLSRGSQVIQVAVMGAVVDAEAADTFFSSLNVEP